MRYVITFRCSGILSSVMREAANQLVPVAEPTMAVVGWREVAHLPLLTPTLVRAKIDTGATTSAIHASGITIAHRADGEAFVSFTLHTTDQSDGQERVSGHPVVAFRFVRSSTGEGEYRPVIRTALVIGQKSFEAEVSLTERDRMGYRMLIGREALRGRFHIDPEGSFLQGKIPKT